MISDLKKFYADSWAIFFLTLRIQLARLRDYKRPVKRALISVSTVHGYIYSGLEYNHDYLSPWWRHQMETFFALLALCEGNPPVPGGFPSQRLVTRSLDVFFDLRPNKRFSKQPRRRWFETPSRSLWRHYNGLQILLVLYSPEETDSKF